MKLILNFLILIFFLTYSLESKSQLFYAISKNSKYFTFIENTFTKKIKTGQTNILYLYNVSTQKALLAYPVDLASEKVKSLKISPDGKTIAIITASVTYVIDVLSQSIIRKLDSEYIYFSNSDNYFLAYDNNKLKSYDVFTGKEIITYLKSSPSSKTDNSIIITDDDNYIIDKSNPRKIKIWNIDGAMLLKQFSANDLGYDFFNKTFTVIQKLKTFTYSAIKLNFINSVDLKVVVENYILASKAKEYEIPFEILQTSISKSGNFVLVAFKRAFEKNFLLVSTLDSKATPIFESDSLEFNKFSWMNDSILNIKIKKNKVNQYIFTESGINLRVLDLEIPKRYINRLLFSPEKLSLSPLLTYTFLDKSNFIRNKIVSKRNLSPFQVIQINNAKLISVTPNDSFLIIKKSNKYGVIKLKGEQNPNANQFFAFQDTVIPIIDNNELQEIEPPKDYKNHRILGIQHIQSAKDSSTKINLLMRSLELSDSIISFDVHLIDDKGIYYYGAAEEEWKNIWCNLLIQKATNPIRQLTSFEVEEFRATDSLPGAYAIVLDHSGSMGDKRAVRLQQEAENFILKKKENDAVSIIKYDNKIGIESQPECDIVELRKRLKKDGIKNYGRSTSLLDASNAGVSTLQHSKNYKYKSVILLTDGLENSSITSRFNVINRAVIENVNVYTIGFGACVNRPFLKSISDHTGGNYYQLYKSKDFDWIFNDVKTKITNYYKIKFKVNEIGKYRILLKVCIDSIKSDTLAFEFELKDKVLRTNLNYLKKLYENYNISSYNSITDNKKIDSLLIFSNINDFSNVVVNRKHIDNIKKNNINDTIDYTMVQEEFDMIEFPDIKFEFDKSVVVPNSDKGIEELINFLKKYVSVKIEIEGHTDNIGNEEYNKKLSLNRANAIKEIIISHGISNDRISLKGYGKSKPIVKNDTENNKQINRRVEFRIVN